MPEMPDSISPSREDEKQTASPDSQGRKTVTLANLMLVCPDELPTNEEMMRRFKEMYQTGSESSMDQARSKSSMDQDGQYNRFFSASKSQTRYQNPVDGSVENRKSLL